MSSISLQEGGAFQSLQMVLQDDFGIVIGEERQKAIAAKLGPVLTEFSFGSLDALVEEAQNRDALDLRNSILHAITAHQDPWFQPGELFDLFNEYLLAEILNSDRKQYRIWVVGCGAGQLPYSLAMKIHEATKDSKSAPGVTIEATDVSDSIVQNAARGVFDEASMEDMIDPYRQRYMDEKAGQWHVVDEIKSMVRFSTCNLLEDFDDKGHFDLIICVDLLVYFSVPVRAQILESFASLLDPAGILVAGINEPVLPFNKDFDMVRHDAGIFYRQKSE